MKKTGYLKKINSESVVQQIIDSLTEAMINRQLRPGDKIPTETDLAEELGVGRNSVREAIKILVYLGVLEIRRAEGTFVCEGFSESMIDPMVYGIILDKADSYEKLMELREMMEVGVMQLAMQKISGEELKKLEEKLAQMRRIVEMEQPSAEQFFLVDNEFHGIISEMGQNPLAEKINQVVSVLTNSLRMHTVQNMIGGGRGRELYEAHARVYEMLKKKESKDLNQAVRRTYFSEAAFGGN